MRVCTFPRNGTARKSGRRSRSWHVLRNEDVPIEAPCGTSASRKPLGLTKASRGSSRIGTHAKNNSGGRSDVMSFEAIAQPNRRAGRAELVDLLYEQTLAANLRKRCRKESVSLRRHLDQRDRKLGVVSVQKRRDMSCLPKRQWTFSRGNSEFFHGILPSLSSEHPRFPPRQNLR